jgi:Uncharacterized conserved protein (DUF2249)
MWSSAEGTHIDVRGLPPPEPMVAILQLIDGEEAPDVVIAHLDREPIFLYPELDDRGWSYELIEATCGNHHCEDEVKVRLLRCSA